MEPVHGYIEMALLTARDPKSKIKIIKLLKLLEFKAIKNKKKRERRLEGKKKVREMGGGVRRRRGSFACFSGHSSTPSNSTEL